MLRLRGREAGGRDASRPCSRLPPRRGEAATSGATLLPVPVLVSIAAAHLAANFAARVVHRMDIGIGGGAFGDGDSGVGSPARPARTRGRAPPLPRGGDALRCPSPLARD